ncbi:MAG: hypothetical protein IPJ81_08925 [Chitinophagaceae bacterium]|nr:hypothetical protein [Chitinophagaceae bacterium]
MKQRLLTKWTFTRVLYIIMGGFVIIQSIMIRQWPGVALGSYFASMGLFAFGCASGNCFSGNCEAGPQQKSNTTIQDVKFEEVKTK